MTARRLMLSNGELYVGLNASGLVDTLHFPYIGHENHTPQAIHRIGVWVDGCMSWLSDTEWTHRAKYPGGALVGQSVAVNNGLGIILELEDFVESDADAFIRNIHVINIREQQRSVRLFCHQAFTISGYVGEDTAQYIPPQNALLHYRGRRAFVASGMTDIGQGFDQYAVGQFGDGLEGTWRDADDGELAMTKVDCGQTDSTMGFSMIIGALSSRRVHYWLVASTSVRSALEHDVILRKQGVYKRLASTTDWWRKQLKASYKVSEQLESASRRPFIESLMSIHAHIDRRGALMCDALGSQKMVCDPAVASFAIWPLIRLGFRQEALRFFTFIRQSLDDKGCLMPSYHADGSLAASRMAYDDNGAPIDSKQTAAALFVFTQFHALNKQSKHLKEYYETLVVPMANFLADFVDERGLPLPCHDAGSAKDSKELTCFTSSLTHAALMAAVEFAETTKDQSRSVKWRTAAEEMRQAALSVFVADGRLVRADGQAGVDIVSLYGVFMFGLLEMDDPAVLNTVSFLEEQFLHENGLFRSNDGQFDYIGSLWMAQYYMESGDQHKAQKIIDTMTDILARPEQSEQELSVWVRAEYVNTLLDRLINT